MKSAHAFVESLESGCLSRFRGLLGTILTERSKINARIPKLVSGLIATGFLASQSQFGYEFTCPTGTSVEE